MFGNKYSILKKVLLQIKAIFLSISIPCGGSAIVLHNSHHIGKVMLSVDLGHAFGLLGRKEGKIPLYLPYRYAAGNSMSLSSKIHDQQLPRHTNRDQASRSGIRLFSGHGISSQITF